MAGNAAPSEICGAKRCSTLSMWPGIVRETCRVSLLGNYRESDICAPGPVDGDNK